MKTASKGAATFLKLMGASLALAGLTACTRQPTEHIMPYVRQPEDLIPGRPLFYATAMTLGGVANGVLVESHEGRPTKVEGNPEHPATLGACDAFSQASVLQTLRSGPLAGPDSGRRNPLLGRVSSDALRGWLDAAEEPRTARVSASSPRPSLRRRWRTSFAPSGSCIPRPSGTSGSRPGRTARAPAPCWHSASRPTPITTWPTPTSIVSLDSDFLASGAASLRYARQFAARRRVRGGQTAMNRLYVVEPMPTPTGTKADHRLPLRAGDMEEFAWALAAALGVAKAPMQRRERRHL